MAVRKRGNKRSGFSPEATQEAIDTDEAIASLRHDKDRAHDLDVTPFPVAYQICLLLLQRWMKIKANQGKTEIRLCDMFAGPGVWSMAFRKAAEALGLLSHITALELRPEELENLQHHADEVITGDYSLIQDSAPFDIIGGNPSFFVWGQALPIMLRKIHKSGTVAALVHNGLGQRGQKGHAMFEEHCPKEQWRIPGYIRFRVGINPRNGKPYGADARDYSMWIWDSKLNGGPEWATKNLPWLPSSQRRWIIRPGTEWRQEFIQGDIFGEILSEED